MNIVYEIYILYIVYVYQDGPSWVKKNQYQSQPNISLGLKNLAKLGQKSNRAGRAKLDLLKSRLY